MAYRLIKSAVYIVAFGSLGYALLATTTLSENNIQKLKKDLPGVEKSPIESRNKKQQFANVLQAAADSKHPLYRLNKEALDKELKKT